MKKTILILLILASITSGCQPTIQKSSAFQTQAAMDKETHSPIYIDLESQQVRPVVAEEPDDVKLSATNYNAAFVDDTGNLWVWGANPDGMLGVGNDTTIKEPQMVMSDVKYVYLVDLTHGEAGSKKHGAMFIVKNNGDMLCSGYNLNGIFGESFGMTSSQEPRRVFEPIKIKSGINRLIIEAVSTFPVVFALTESGELWYWGRGILNENGMAQPTKLFDKDITFVDAELGISYIVTGASKLYAFYPTGDDLFGEGEDVFIKPNESESIILPHYKKDGVIAAKYAAAHYALLQKVDGALWKVWNQIEMQLLEDVVDFDIDYPSMKMFALTKHGDLYTFEIEDENKAPTKIAEGITLARIFRSCIYMINETGELFQYDLDNNITHVLCSRVKDVTPANNGVFVKKVDGSIWAIGDNTAWALGLPEGMRYSDFYELSFEEIKG